MKEKSVDWFSMINTADGKGFLPAGLSVSTETFVLLEKFLKVVKF